MTKLTKIFKKNKNILIGALHFPPLLSYPDFPGLNIALKNAIKDLNSFERGGVDSIIFENNYDIPHTEFVDPAVTASMMYLGEKIKKATKLPLGISVLWNDYKTALSIAKLLNLKFIRIPVFVDTAKTDYGVISGKSREIINYRKNMNAEDVLLFTDIHVKHAKILSRHNLIQSAKLAMKNGSDGLIITGKWTGDAPNLNELKNLRKTVGDFPIFAGSGVNLENIKDILTYANGAIVSTSLKKGFKKQEEINIKSYEQRIDIAKTKALTKKVSLLR
jgi:membrane complex biogenesis BtpA family protein